MTTTNVTSLALEWKYAIERKNTVYSHLTGTKIHTANSTAYLVARRLFCPAFESEQHATANGPFNCRQLFQRDVTVLGVDVDHHVSDGIVRLQKLCRYV